MSFTSKWNLITFAPAYPRSSYPFPYFSRPSVYPISSSLSLFSLPLSSLFLFAGPPCFSIFFDHLCSSLLPSSPPLVTFRVKTHREVFTLEWKYLNFAASSSGNYCSRRFVRLQLRAHFSSAIPSVIPARITSIPLPSYLSFRAVYSASKYSNAVAIISFRLGLVVHHRRAVSLYLFFPSRNTWSRQLPSFLWDSRPPSLLLPHLVINFAESVRPHPLWKASAPESLFVASSFDENA